MAQPYNYTLNTSPAEMASAPLKGLGMANQAVLQRQAIEAEKQRVAAEQASAQQQEQISLLSEKALSGDDDAARQLFLISPEMAQKTDEFLGVRDEQTKAQVSDWFGRYLSVPEQQRKQFLQETAAQTPFAVDDQLLAMPDEQLRAYEKIIAPRYLSKEQYAAIAPKSDSVKPTTKMQDFAKFQELKDTDPEAAQQFGVAAGFIDQETGAESTPASVRETEWFLNQTPEVQKKHIELKRKTDPTMAEKLEFEQSKSDIKVGEEGKKTSTKSMANRQQGYIDSGVDAADSLGNAYKVRGLLDSVETGGFNNASLAAKRLFGIESADEAELSAGLGKAILSQLKPIFGAAFTAAEGERLERIEANFGKSTEGNRRLIDEVIKISERAANRGIRAAEAQGDKFAADEIRAAMDAIKEEPSSSNVGSATEEQAATGMSDEELLKSLGL